MKSLVSATALLASLAGCVSTTHFSKEYNTAYVLRGDTTVAKCRIFTGAYSVYFGPENVLCLGDRSGDKVIKSGSIVKVNRLFKIGAVDAFYDTAELSISDEKTGKVITVYLENWPDKEKFLKVP